MYVFTKDIFEKRIQVLLVVLVENRFEWWHIRFVSFLIGLMCLGLEFVLCNVPTST